jgi:hypothetical protein
MITREQQSALVALALWCRTSGPRWDAGDLLDSIRRVAHLNLAAVAMATLQAAADPKARHPDAIAAYGVHWGLPAAPRPEPPPVVVVAQGGSSSFRGGGPAPTLAPRVAAHVCPGGFPVAVDGSCCGRDHGKRG